MFLVHFGENGAVSSKHQPKSRSQWRDTKGCQLSLGNQEGNLVPSAGSSHREQECKEL